MANQVEAGASLWRREPFRVLFPMGMLLGWAGVLHWFLLGIGLTQSYQSVFHSMAQIQGMLTAFACGFLMTFIPRRMRAAPASRWELGLALVLPVVCTAAAWFEQFALAQTAWVAVIVTLLVFAVRRGRSASGVKMHASFVWVPLSLLAAVSGAVMTAVGGIAGDDWMWLHDIGKSLVLQGLFTGLVIGIGGLLLPALTRGGDPAAGMSLPDRQADRLLHVAAALLFFATFFLELRSVQGAYALRAAMVVWALVYGAKLYRRPTQPGLSRWLVWAAAWMVPVGFVAVALFPAYRVAALHVVFIGGFSLLTFTIASHVALSHGRGGPITRTSPATLKMMAALLTLALVFRALLSLDPVRFSLWIAAASFCFLAATVSWAVLVFRYLRVDPSQCDEPGGVALPQAP